MSIKMTLSRIETLTFRLVKQYLPCYVVCNDNGGKRYVFSKPRFYDSQSNFSPATEDGRLG